MNAVKGDSSKNTLAVVLMVIIFVSMLGTWIVLSAIDNVQLQPGQTIKVIQQGPPATGMVSLDILPSKQKESGGNK